VGVVKGLGGCLISFIVVIILGIIGFFAFFTLSPQEINYEEYTRAVVSESPDGKWRVEILEKDNGEPYEVYYGERQKEVSDMSMIYLPVEDYQSPSIDLEWKDTRVVDIILLDGEQEKSRITLTIGEE